MKKFGFAALIAGLMVGVSAHAAFTISIRGVAVDDGDRPAYVPARYQPRISEVVEMRALQIEKGASVVASLDAFLKPIGWSVKWDGEQLAGPTASDTSRFVGKTENDVLLNALVHHGLTGEASEATRVYTVRSVKKQWSSSSRTSLPSDQSVFQN